MNIVFVSFIDSTNIGDLLIAEVLEEELMKEHNVLKYSFNLIPEGYISKGQREGINRNYKFLIKKIYNEHIRKIDMIDRLHLLRMKYNIDKNKYLDKFDNDIKNSDLVIIGGGNAIFDLTRHSLSAYKFNKILKIVKKYNRKSLVTSIGIGPFQTQEQLDYTINTLKDADYITVRDKKSYNYLTSINKKVHLSIDPVFLLNNANGERIKKTYEQKVISFCIIDLLLNKDDGKKYTKLIDNAVRLVNNLKHSDENYIINLFSTEPRDYRAVNDVYNKLIDKNKVNLINVNNSKDLLNLYKNTDVIIGTRMHSLIIGLSQYIPVIGISWQDKVKEMFEMINSSEDVFDVNDLENNIMNIVSLVNQKLSNKETFKYLKTIKNQNRQKFEINKELLSILGDEINEEKR
ncbi:polysaccharide pyruvyl transferase WcaK-like protein [Metabacillus crassostreae]|uniref:polysaccharide pyruvyl transferase family protein n=1 Tax=Metabacillus crassostreae TaxID=929098 RepID=UPI0019580217|nr:polysaccharide pyruvyl transferase family protein [Metabacillus crassostreae]MBM7606288.1 polysaccharide pyruvyl transferase WcaK-like protein [Metabacillus crassostreae]